MDGQNTTATGEQQWAAVDKYIVGALLTPDPVLESALASSEASGLPPHHVSPPQGMMLHLLARIQQARRILEIGTLGGYSTIWLARALPPGGRLLTIEASEHHAAVARTTIEHAGLADVIEIRIGPASETLRALIAAGEPPFDLIFIDADKPGNPEYLALTLQLSRRGTVIIADNVVRNGAVADADSSDPSVRGIRLFHEQLAADPRLAATAIQTVGGKGYDGFTLVLVTGDPQKEQ